MKPIRWITTGFALLLLAGSGQVIAQPKIVSDDEKVSKADGKIAKNSAKFYISQKMYDDALDKLAVAARGLPDDPEVHFMIGQLNNEKLREAMRKGGQDQEERIQKMNHHFDACLGLKKGEKKFGKKIRQMRDFWWTEYFNGGIAAYNAGDHGEALNGFQRSALVIPGKGLTYKMLGSTYQAMRQNEAAIDSYLKSIELDSTDATAYANLAIALINSGKAEGAIEYLKRANHLDPGNLQILQNMSMVQLQTGDNQGALETVEKALAADPENLNALRTAGQIYLMSQDFQRASELFEKVLEQDPTEVAVAENLAIAYLSMSEFEKARKLYEDAVERSPENAQAWYQLGFIHDSGGNVEGALTAFEKVVELDPTDALAWRALYRVYLTKSQSLEGAAAKEAVKKGEKAYEMAESLTAVQE